TKQSSEDPVVTCHTRDNSFEFKGILDYIMFFERSGGRFESGEIMWFNGVQEGLLPTTKNPSDHVPVRAHISFPL
ncbi:hypothetical protein KDA14_04855, partial [Candidatus Saccharibacteria bacterium]|nr:hypothetical protein [Candidatus Saccharibacteria bacterium]